MADSRLKGVRAYSVGMGSRTTYAYGAEWRPASRGGCSTFLRKAVLAIACFLILCFGIGLSLSLEDAKAPEGAVVALVIVIGVLGYLAALRLTRTWQRRDLRKADSLTLGHQDEGQSYVGVAYSDGAWTVAGDVSWDRGYLSLTHNFVVYKGLATSFRLPLVSIDAVEVKPIYSIDWIPPRVYIRWSAYGATHVLSVEDRERGTKQGAVTSILDLKARIEQAQDHALRSIRSAAFPAWVHAAVEGAERLYPDDQLVAISRTLLIAIPMVALAIAFPSSGLRIAGGFVCLLTYGKALRDRASMNAPEIPPHRGPAPEPEAVHFGRTAWLASPTSGFLRIFSSEEPHWFGVMFEAYDGVGDVCANGRVGGVYGGVAAGTL